MEPMDVPAHGSIVFTFSMRVHRPGPFNDGLSLYLDDGVLREVEVAVQGEAVQAPAQKPATSRKSTS